jgi:hypothetical protein
MFNCSKTHTDSVLSSNCDWRPNSATCLSTSNCVRPKEMSVLEYPGYFPGSSIMLTSVHEGTLPSDSLAQPRPQQQS